MTEPKTLFDAAGTILLVDWADAMVPYSLVAAGHTVFCYSPGGFTKASIELESLKEGSGKTEFRHRNMKKGFLALTKLDKAPDQVDLVNIFRPGNEVPGLINNVVLPLNARIVWLQPGVDAHEAEKSAIENHLTLVKGIDICSMLN